MGIFSKAKRWSTGTTSYSSMTESASSIMGDYNATTTALESQLYIADAIITRRVLLEGANQEVLVEATIKDVLTKVKNAMKKLKDKIVAWFNEHINWIKVYATQTKGFLKKWESAIREKVKSSGYKGKETGNIIDYDVDATVQIVSKMKALFTTAQGYSEGDIKEDTKNKLVQDVIRLTKSTAPTSSAIKKALTDIGTSYGVKKSYKLGTSEVETLLKDAKKAEARIPIITRLKESVKKHIDASIKEVNAMESSETNGSFIKDKLAILNMCNGLFSAASTTVANLYKAELRQSVRLLKKVMVTNVSESLDDIAEDLLNDQEIEDEDIDAIVESAIEIEGAEPETPEVEDSVEDTIDETMDEELDAETEEGECEGEPEENSVLAEAALFL